MQQGVRNSLFWIAGFIALILGLFMASYMTPKSLSKAQFQELGFYRFDTARQISQFNLIDHTGAGVTNNSLEGSWSLLFFGFTYCPDVCPTTLSVLNEAVSNLENPPQVIMVSVDPERDTPSLLADYVPRFNPAFKGYTGEFDEIVSVATELNVAFGKVPGPELGTYTVEHSASIVVMNPLGQYAGFIRAPHNAQNIQRIVSHLN
jgi:protein SCO1/2